VTNCVSVRDVEKAGYLLCKSVSRIRSTVQNVSSEVLSPAVDSDNVS
jgi:hypothetical protein